MNVRGKQLRLAVLVLLLGAFIALLVVLVDDTHESTAVELVQAPPKPVAQDAGADEASALQPTAPPQATPTPEPVVDAPVPEPQPAYDGPTHIVGRVTDPSGVGLAGAHVNANLVRGEFNNAMGSAKTDNDGRYEIQAPNFSDMRRVQMNVDAQLRELQRAYRDPSLSASEKEAAERRFRDAVEAASDESAQLILRVGARYVGYGMAEDSRKIALPLPRETIVDLVLEPGLILEGFVLAKDGGRPVAGATVTLLDNSFVIVKSSASNELGRWWMNLEIPGLYQLFARQERVGTAFEPKLAIDPGVDHRMPDLLLMGDGRLDGTVTYPDGRAVEGFALEARHDSILFLPDGALTESERIQKERGLGLVIGGAITNMHGDFALRGLQPGRFALRFAEVSDPRLQPPLLYAVGTQHIALTFGGHRLRVSVRQEQTPLLDPPQITCDKIVVERDGGSQLKRIGSWSGAGDWCRVVDTHERYLVRASASGTQEDWTVVEIGEFPYETVALLRLWPENSNASSAQGTASDVAGQVHVSVVDAEKHVLNGWLATLRSKESQRVISGMNRAAPAKDGTLPAVAPGEYELTLACAPRGDAFALFGTAPIDVLVHAGRTTSIEVEAALGARLKLITHELAAARGANRPRVAATINRRGSKDTAGTPLVFIAPDPPSTVVGNRLLLGGSALCEPLLEPGDYYVVVERENGSTYRYEAKLEPGRVFELDINDQH